MKMLFLPILPCAPPGPPPSVPSPSQASDRAHVEAVPGEGMPTLPGPRSPGPDRGVVRPRNHGLAGRGERYAGHLALVPRKHLPFSI